MLYLLPKKGSNNIWWLDDIKFLCWLISQMSWWFRIKFCHNNYSICNLLQRKSFILTGMRCLSSIHLKMYQDFWMFISLLLPKFRAHLLLLLSSITELVALVEDKNEKISPEFCRISADFGRFWRFSAEMRPKSV
jgi:hypothetical protein